MNLALNIRWIATSVPERTLRRTKRRLRTAGLETAKLDLNCLKFLLLRMGRWTQTAFSAKEVISIPWGDVTIASSLDSVRLLSSG